MASRRGSSPCIGHQGGCAACRYSSWPVRRAIETKRVAHEVAFTRGTRSRTQRAATGPFVPLLEPRAPVVWGFRRHRSGDAPASTDGGAAGRWPPPSPSARERRGDESRRLLPAASLPPPLPASRHECPRVTRAVNPPSSGAPGRAAEPLLALGPNIRRHHSKGQGPSTDSEPTGSTPLSDGAVTIGPIFQSLPSRRPISF
jgi:hypothetical protein